MMKTTNEADDRSAMSMKEDELRELYDSLHIADSYEDFKQLITERDAAIRIDELKKLHRTDAGLNLPIVTMPTINNRIAELKAIKRKDIQ